MTRVVLIGGLGFGDEGKGTTVDWLARRAPTSLVVRYNGGAQAAHNVVADRHHTFAQFGSGTFAGVPTFLSRYVLVNPISALAEARHLVEVGIPSPFELLFVDENALVTTPFQIAMNRLREMTRTGRHGSCGMGIGETMQDSLEDAEPLRVGDLRSPSLVREKLERLRAKKLESLARLTPPSSASSARERRLLEAPDTIPRCLEAFADFVRLANLDDGSRLDTALRSSEQVLFEGAQGVLLDQDFGFQPHTTWTNITFDNTHALLDERGFRGDVTRLGVLRAYATRHGAGPFVTEDPAMDALSAHDHNRTGEWQGSFRSGAFDLVTARYALDVVGGVDGLVVTNLDRIALAERAEAVPVAVAYENVPAEYFVSNERIRVRRPFDLSHQEGLTKAMFDARAVYETFDARSPLAYARELAMRLGTSLDGASFGPRAGDKVVVTRSSDAPSRFTRTAVGLSPANATSNEVT
ncbi:adenylosuccinate synthetase [Labilithrix luteola]|uniref:adenylosuccinate synthetase n=1 Tax=Labilithrix luteola TaxID=1391654 RepID=UPI000B18668D|nr:adenylosuccinate synthetase [Labilithrix luteola]